MDILKTAIFTACIIGIVSSLTDMAAPDGALKKQLKIILTIIMILGIFTPFLSGGFKLDLNAADELIERKEYDNINENFEDLYLSRSSESIEQVLTQLIEDQGISVEKISIDSQLDEYNSLEIKKVTVYLIDPTLSDKERVRAIISENLSGTATEFSEEDDSGY